MAAFDTKTLSAWVSRLLNQKRKELVPVYDWTRFLKQYYKIEKQIKRFFPFVFCQVSCIQARENSLRRLESAPLLALALTERRRNAICHSSQWVRCKEIVVFLSWNTTFHWWNCSGSGCSFTLFLGASREQSNTARIMTRLGEQLVTLSFTLTSLRR